MRGSQTPALLLRSLSPVSITLTPACQSDLTGGLLTLLKVWALVSFDLGPLPAPGIKANWVQVSLCSLGLLIHHLFSLSGFMYLSSMPGFFAEEKPMREEKKGRGGGRQPASQTVRPFIVSTNGDCDHFPLTWGPARGTPRSKSLRPCHLGDVGEDH